MEAAAPPPLPIKPRFRGVVHQWSFFVALAAGARAGHLGARGACHGRVGRIRSGAGRAAGDERALPPRDLAAARACLAAPARPLDDLRADRRAPTHRSRCSCWTARWRRGAGRSLGRRHRGDRCCTLLWVNAPKLAGRAASYVALGWFAVISVPQIVSHAGAGAAVLLAVGGVAYTAGAVVYARRRPDPRPATFGYHEIFHVLVVIAAAVHFTAVAVFAVPYGP